MQSDEFGKKSRVENFLTLSFSVVTLNSLLVHTQFVMSDFFMDFVGFPEFRRANRKLYILYNLIYYFEELMNAVP